MSKQEHMDEASVAWLRKMGHPHHTNAWVRLKLCHNALLVACKQLLRIVEAERIDECNSPDKPSLWPEEISLAKSAIAAAEGER